MNTVSKIILAMGTSVAIGAALGMLFAPDEGYETRKKLIKKGKKFAGVVSVSMDDGLESLEEIKDVLQKQLGKVNRKLEEYKV